MNIIDSEAKLAEIEQREKIARSEINSPHQAKRIAARQYSQDVDALCATVRQLWERDRWINKMRESVDEYRRLSTIPVDEFPGHRSMALLNLVAYIGECAVAALPAPPPETEEQP